MYEIYFYICIDFYNSFEFKITSYIILYYILITRNSINMLTISPLDHISTTPYKAWLLMLYIIPLCLFCFLYGGIILTLKNQNLQNKSVCLVSVFDHQVILLLIWHIY